VGLCCQTGGPFGLPGDAHANHRWPRTSADSCRHGKFVMTDATWFRANWGATARDGTMYWCRDHRVTPSSTLVVNSTRFSCDLLHRSWFCGLSPILYIVTISPFQHMSTNRSPSDGQQNTNSRCGIMLSNWRTFQSTRVHMQITAGPGPALTLVGRVSLS
jgi:hypothetical protein